MRRTTTSLLAAGLICAGALGDHLVSSNSSGPALAANGNAAPQAATSAPALPSSSVAALDAATEHAFSVASPSVVYVSNVGVGSGSGVIYDSTGDIVTNAHVVANAQSITVTLSNGKTFPAKVVGTDVADDLAVIHVNASKLPAAKFAPAGNFRVAQTVLAIGNPLNLQQSVTSGLISALGRTVQESTGAYLPDAIQTSAPINPGNSGGALVTLSGTVVGIPTLEASDPQNNNGGAAQGIGFAIPSGRVTVIANQIIKYGRVVHSGRSYLGVGAADNSAQSGFGFGGNAAPTVPGALVNNVASGSPAAQAGIQQGDVITRANGQAITGSNDLLTVLAHAKPGNTMTITVNRNGQTITLHAHLGELPAS
ncbi:MAG: serine protease [Chloroflexi bacterium]|nr:serine protease [Chloroflexota bacterium]